MTLFNRKDQNPNVHATLDLETLGTGANAVVFEIGAGIIDLTGSPAPIKTRCWTFELQHAMACGEVTPNTLAWWIADPGIPVSVRERLHKIWSGKDNYKAHSIVYALNDLNSFLSEYRPMSIWANGAAFDFPILRDFFASVRRQFPHVRQAGRVRPCWGFRDEMCLRPLRRASAPLWSAAKKEAEMLAPDVLGQESGIHAADYDCLVNLLFLEKVNRQLPLVHEEVARAANNA